MTFVVFYCLCLKGPKLKIASRLLQAGLLQPIWAPLRRKNGAKTDLSKLENRHKNHAQCGGQCGRGSGGGKLGCAPPENPWGLVWLGHWGQGWGPQENNVNPWWGRWEPKLETLKNKIKSLVVVARVGQCGWKARLEATRKQCKILGGVKGKPGCGSTKKT